MQTKGVQYTLLLLGKVQVDNVHNDQRELLIEELFLQGINIESTEKIKTLKKFLLNNEYPDSNNTSCNKLFFYSRLLDAEQWWKDHLPETLAKIEEMRSKRSSR